MKVEVHSGEAFPIYSIYDNIDAEYSGFDLVEVKIATLKRWKKVFDDFTKVQNEIIDVLDKHAIDYWVGHPTYSGFNVNENKLK